MIIALHLTAAMAANPGAIDLAADRTFSRTSESSPVPTTPWWQALGDPQLERLVEEGLGGNNDVGAAWARVRQAQAGTGSALAPLLPSASFDVSANGQPAAQSAFCQVGAIDFGPSAFELIAPLYQLVGDLADGQPLDPAALPELPQTEAPAAFDFCWTGSALFNVGWQVDAFGRGLLAHRAARFDADAARGDRDAQALAVSTQIAEAYLDVVAANHQVEIVQEQLDAQQALLEVIELRFEQGSATALDVLQQRQTVAGTEALLPSARIVQRTRGASLAVLLGRAPDGVPEVGAALPETPELPATGMPADLLDNRPDLRAASARLGSATARKRSAVRSLLPTLRLQANAGWQFADSNEFSSIEAWSVGGTLSVPLFNGGATHAAIRQSKAVEDASVYAWNQAVLGALRDVESAMVSDTEQAARHAAVQRQAVAADQAMQESTERYLAGLDSYLSVLASQNADLGAELSELQAHRDRLSARIQLHTSLGGRWTDDIVSPSGSGESP